jgi:hypothetical protein
MQCARPARPRVLGTGASGLHRLARLGGLTRSGCGGVSGHMRPDASDRVRSSLDSDWTPGAARPVKR